MISLGVPWPGNDLVHNSCVAAGIALALVVFGYEARRRGNTDPRLTVIVAVALLSGAVAARLGTWWQHPAPAQNAPLAEHWMYGNRSVVGGLLGAWLGVHLGKRAVGYRARTGDLFAPAVAAGMAVGRIGCLLTETPGGPTGGAWGVVLDPAQATVLAAPSGVGLHPSFGYEIAFHAVAFLLIWANRDRLASPGGLFVLYLSGYAAFRVGVEFVRGNDPAWAGLTRTQLVLLPLLPLLAWRCWAVLRRGTAPSTTPTLPGPRTRSMGPPSGQATTQPARAGRGTAREASQ